MASRWVVLLPRETKLMASVPCVYALYRGDTLFYVGRTVNLRNRFGLYRRRADITHAKARLVNIDDLDRIERRLIRRLRPSGNVQHTGRRYHYFRDNWARRRGLLPEVRA